MAKNRLIGEYPVIGIRPTIDGRRGCLGVRESLDVRMNPYREVDIPEEARIDYQMVVGNDVVHFIGLVPYDDQTAIPNMKLYFDVYDKNIFNELNFNIDYDKNNFLNFFNKVLVFF